MDLVDSKYISLLSSRLDKFSNKKPGLYNFRCPLCGDSQKNKSKTRGYLYAYKTNTNYKCHNCGASMSFPNFLKKIDSVLFKQYQMEKFTEGHAGKNFSTPLPDLNFKKPVFKSKSKINLPKASENEKADTYLKSRNLNSHKFYYAEKFKEWSNTQIKSFDSVAYDEPRIIIPLYTKEGNLFGFQGRALNKSKIKYITILIDEDHPKVYGLNEVNEDETIFVVEGPFDSTFINNAIAMCGADVPLDSFQFKDIVYVYDNEPRNKEICSRMQKVIDKGHKIVIFPKKITQKDINDMVLDGIDVNSMLKSNTYQALTARIKFNEWKKL